MKVPIRIKHRTKEFNHFQTYCINKMSQNPKINYLLFCDHASVTMEGKLNIMGIFNSFLMKSVPAVQSQFHIVADMLIPNSISEMTFILAQKGKIIGTSNIKRPGGNIKENHTHIWRVKNLKIATWDHIELILLLNKTPVFKKILILEKTESGS